MELIDSHCHLDMDDFSEDIEAVLDRARAADVVQLVTIGVDAESSERAIALAETYDHVSATVGHHPHDARTLTAEGLDRLRDLARQPQVVGFGEIGLDFFYQHSPVQVQRDRFDDLIHLGIELGLPLIIHDRDAHQEVYEHLASAGASTTGGVIHCFSGDYDTAKRFLDMGFYVSIPGTITFPKSVELRDVVARLPLDRILIETDAPYLAPVPRRGRRNEPALVAFTAAEVARVKNLTLDEVAEATTANARTLFRLNHGSTPSR